MNLRPENALQKATERINVRKLRDALDGLLEFLSFKSKRVWSQRYEDMMRLFIWLCVELRDSYAAKDGLIKYRTFFQQQAPESLENVLNYLLDLSEARVNKTLKLCRDVNSSKMDDLEEGGSPEDLLLATVTTDGDRVRNEVGLLKPWLSFAWENLRTVLDLLRNNTDLETYHDTAIRAFAFCLKHERRQEFMRLSGSLRDHLLRANLSKDGGAKDLSPEVMELHLSTRYEQLRIATALHLWVAGFNTIEDIHGIIASSSKSPSPSLMATYYQKLTELFLLSGNYLFHAYTFKAYYDISREKNKSVSPAALSEMASIALLSALCVPLPSTISKDVKLQREKQKKMAHLLFLSNTTERGALVETHLSKNSPALKEAKKDVAELFQMLESEKKRERMSPRDLVAQCVRIIDSTLRADKAFEVYVEPIERLLITRLISHLGMLYESVSLSEFHSLVDLLGSKSSVKRLDAEKLVVYAVKTRTLPGSVMNVRINHLEKSINFNENSLEEQSVKDVLSAIGTRLHAIVELTGAGKKEGFVLDRASLVRENEAMLNRRMRIAKKREEIESMLSAEIRQAKEKQIAAQREREEKERENVSRKEAERLEREEEEKRKAEEKIKTQQRLLQMGFDPNDFSVPLEEREREYKERKEKQLQLQKEAERKATTKVKRLDALTRAMREAEKHLWIVESEKQRIRNQNEYREEEEREREKERLEHKNGLQLKSFFVRISPEATKFKEDIKAKFWVSAIMQDREMKLVDREDRRMLGKLDRARQRREEAARRRKVEEEQLRRSEFEEKRILEAERENERKKEEKERSVAEVPTFRRTILKNDSEPKPAETKPAETKPAEPKSDAPKKWVPPHLRGKQ